ncbi:hypothetical protein LguiA_021567 [Lonicera macranthoides]
MSITTRRPKWHPTPPPPPSPQILNLPRRTTRRKKQSKTATNHPEPQRNHRPETGLSGSSSAHRGKLESLFDEEGRGFSGSVPIVLLRQRRRERVEVERESGGGGFVEEKWRFQAEILRAECNFLRMEREFALKKLERNRVQMERTLRSAVHTLVSGRKKIYHGKNVSVVLEEEIEDLADKLEELQRSYGIGDFEVRKCNNFDKKASVLQRRLEKLGGLSDEKCLKEIRGMPESSLWSCQIDQDSVASDCKSANKSTNGEMVRMKMGGISKGMLDRMEEEFGSMISTTTATPNSSVASSASNSKRIEFLDSSSFYTRQPDQANFQTSSFIYYTLCIYNENFEVISLGEKKCSGRCKAIVRRVVEQVRAETEQWSQMQEMLGQVREDMEELQASRDFWEDRALDSDYEIRSLLSSLEEWRHKALTFEAKANELEAQVALITKELEILRAEQNREIATTRDLSLPSLGKQLEKEKRVLICHVEDNCFNTSDNEKVDRENARIEQCNEIVATKELPLVSLGEQIAKEKCGLICRLKENHHNNAGGSKNESSRDGKGKENMRGNILGALRRSPLRDIGNSSPLVKADW